MAPRDVSASFHEFASGPAHHVVTHLMQMENSIPTLKSLRIACNGLCSAADATMDSASIDLTLFDGVEMAMDNAIKFLHKTAKHLKRLRLCVPSQLLSPLLSRIGPLPALSELSITVAFDDPDVVFGSELLPLCAPALASLEVQATVKWQQASAEPSTTDADPAEIRSMPGPDASLHLVHAVLSPTSSELRRVRLSHLDLARVMESSDALAGLATVHELHLAHVGKVDATNLARVAPSMRVLHAFGAKFTWDPTVGSAASRHAPQLTSLSMVNCQTRALFDAPRLTKLTLCNVSELESLHTLAAEMPDLAYCRIAMCQDLHNIESLQRSYERIGAPQTMVVIDSMRHPMQMPLYALGMRFSFICGIVYHDAIAHRLIGMSSIRVNSCLLCHAGGRIVYSSHTGTFDSVHEMMTHWA